MSHIIAFHTSTPLDDVDPELAKYLDDLRRDLTVRIARDKGEVFVDIARLTVRLAEVGIRTEDEEAERGE